MSIQVIKRDGSKEDFNSDKISKVCIAAGLEEDQAKILSESVSDWAISTGSEEITSKQIRDQVVSRLAKLDQYAHGLYVWYESTKDQAPKAA